MKDQIEIITATKLHIPGVIELWKELMDFHRNIDAYWSRRENGHIEYEKFLRGMLESEDAIVLVTTDKGQIVGYSSSRINRPSVNTRECDAYGDITDMVVKAEYRRKGIGQQMLAKIFEWFELKNINRIELSVAAQNRVSNSFWKKNGFKDYIHRLYLVR